MILVNGVPAETVDARDRGLAYGDGVFRTLRVSAGRPRWWRDHAAKLAADCAALRLTCPEAGLLYEEATFVAAGEDCALKIILTRGTGARGYAPLAGEPTRIVLATPLPAHAQAGAPTALRARWCELRLSQQPRLAGVKHLNRIENVLACAEWTDPDIAEGLLCDSEGIVVCGTRSNLFWAKDGVLCTPDLGASGVAGVARARLLRVAGRLAIPVRHERALPAVILAADEVMICNSLLGVRRIARLDAVELPEAGWRERLAPRLDDDLD